MNMHHDKRPSLKPWQNLMVWICAGTVAAAFLGCLIYVAYRLVRVIAH